MNDNKIDSFNNTLTSLSQNNVENYATAFPSKIQSINLSVNWLSEISKTLRAPYERLHNACNICNTKPFHNGSILLQQRGIVGCASAFQYKNQLINLPVNQLSQISKTLRTPYERVHSALNVLDTKHFYSALTATKTLQDNLLELYNYQRQNPQKSYEPSDNLVDSLNNTLQKVSNTNAESINRPRFLDKKFFKDNLIGILGLLLTIVFHFAPSNEPQIIIVHEGQNITQYQSATELFNNKNDILQSVANTAHLLTYDIDVFCKGQNIVTVEIDKSQNTMHSPTQDQNANGKQSNTD